MSGFPEDESSDLGVVGAARQLDDVGQARSLYAQWAATYDDEVFGRLGFTGSARIAELLSQEVSDRSGPILDVGCGTGAVGIRLASLGFGVIDGVDLSPEMLAIARASGAYRNLSVADINALAPPVVRYAAAVSAGTFTTGHVGASAVPRVLEQVRPGGLIAWVIGAALWPEFEPVLAAHGVTVLRQSLEPIRRDGPPEGVMLIGRLASVAEE